LDVDFVLNQIAQLTPASVLNDRPNGAASIGDLLKLAGLAEAQQLKLVRAFQGDFEDPAEVWASLSQDPDFVAPGLIERIQTIIQLGELTLNHPRLVGTLQRRGRVAKLQDLAQFDIGDWLGVLDRREDDRPIGLPPGIDIPGETAEDKN